MGNGSPSKTKGREPTPHELIRGGDAKAVAEYMKSNHCKKIVTMAGAGISTSAGIPDFRSPETGLYANLARLNLPFPEAVFEINYFRRNPIPFYTLAHELAPGRYRPTLTHSFIRLLSDKNLLHTHYTQNIDTLERRAGVPDEDIIEAHGSFATSKCIDCRVVYDSDKMMDAIDKKEIPRCTVCNGLAKPDIVFFGESLPPSFFQAISTLQYADLLIVMGTSLTVHPFASLIDLVPKRCPRVLINMDPAGNIGERANDVVLLGQCDEVVREISKEMGWEKALERLWKETEESVEDKYRPAAEDEKEEGEKENDAEKSETKKDEKKPVEAMVKKVEESLDGSAPAREASDSKGGDVDELAQKIEESLHLNKESDRKGPYVPEKKSDAPQEKVQPKIADSS